MNVQYQQPSDVEYLNNYCPGGFHPVHLDDTFKNGRYTVVHKLGHGTFSTVWLVKDSSSGKYASLKILTANASERSENSGGSQETQILSHLQADDADDEGKDYVMQLLDHFEHEGPNGVHRCVVTEVLGPDLNADKEDLYSDEIFPPEIARKLVYQISLGVKYLHKKGIVHGDLHLGNFLLYSPKIAAWSTQEEVDKHLGEPETYPFVLRGATHILAPASPNSPVYYVVAAAASDFDIVSSLMHLCLDDPAQVHVKICDFSESFIFDPTTPVKRKSKTPKIFRDPQTMFDTTDPICPTHATDIWALATVFHMLFTGGEGLFPCGSYDQEDHVLRQMVLYLGKIPEPYWSNWTDRLRYVDDNGKLVDDKSDWLLPPWTPFLKISSVTMNGEERRLFEGMLRSMVVYEPERRVKAGDLFSSQWFLQYCGGNLKGTNNATA